MKNEFKTPRKGKKGAKQNIRSPLKVMVKKLVSAEIHKEAEDKYCTTYQSTYPIAQQFNQGITAMTDFKELLPIVFQGSKMNQRVGNKLSPKSLVVNFTITATGFPFGNSSDLLWARLFVLTHKSYKDYTSLFAQGTPNSLLMVDGENFTQANGYSNDENWRVNRRQWTVIKDKVFKVARGFGTLPQAGNAVAWSGDSIYVAPSTTHRFTVRIPCPKELLYKDATTNTCSNFAPIFGLTYNMPQATTTPSPPQDYRLQVAYVSHFVYEDD